MRKALAFLAPVALVLVAEGTLRALRMAQGQPHRAAERRAAIAELAESMLAPVPRGEDAAGAPLGAGGAGLGQVLHPYVGFDLIPSGEQIQSELVAFSSASGADSYSILIVGGSVAALFSTWGEPRLREMLASDERFAGRSIVFLNHGRGAHKQPQQMLRLAYLLSLGYAPDAVINIDGFNEVAIGVQNAEYGVHPAQPYWLGWAPLVSQAMSGAEERRLAVTIDESRRDAERCWTRTERWHVSYSSLLSALAEWRLKRIRADWSSASVRLAQLLAESDRTAPLKGPSASVDPESALATSVAVWKESSLSMAAMCRSRSILYLHVLQPTLFDAGSKPLTKSERAAAKAEESWKSGARLGYPQLRAAVPELRQRSVSVCDASFAFRDVHKPLYYDACHFRRLGNELLAEAIAREFLAAMPADEHAIFEGASTR